LHKGKHLRQQDTDAWHNVGGAELWALDEVFNHLKGVLSELFVTLEHNFAGLEH
jgi:hypothetical protein